jgi:bla regulator protein blaR1
MTPANFFPLWQLLVRNVADHLWQSTIFVLVAGTLTLTLRKEHPGVRYGIWLASSAKFLIPFSLLVTLGQSLAWLRRPAGPSEFYFAINDLGRPFSQAKASVISQAAAGPVTSPSMHVLPLLLAGLWLGGVGAVLFTWCLRWRRISAAIRRAEPLRKGREVDALHRLQAAASVSRPVEIVLSQTPLEPGVFGIVHPVLLWPEGITARLTDAQLDTVLAHELRHIRRRDNLAAAVHMLVEAIFWFHPLVWWLGARLVEERERACDQEVLQLGNDPQVYAESILRVCEFCIESPVSCVSGVTGSDLRKRMANIMTNPILPKLNFGRKLLLTVAAVLAFATPIFFGLVDPAATHAQSQAADSNNLSFENVSVKPAETGSNHPMVRLAFSPAGFAANGVSLQELIRDAYGVQDSQISGGPDWLKSERFDIEAKIPAALADELRNADPAQVHPDPHAMLRALLADRFKLAVHRESKELPVYVLSIAENGPKLQEAKPGEIGPVATIGRGGPAGDGRMMMGQGMLTAQAMPIAEFARMLSVQLRRPVLDKTGLTARYDISLQWAPGPTQVPDPDAAEKDNAIPVASASALTATIEQKLGLKLQPQESMVETIVIDHAENLIGN